MALTIGPAPAAGTGRGVVPSPWWPRRQPPTADELPVSRVSAGRRRVSTGRSTPTPARVPAAESVRAAQRVVVWRAGTVTVPEPDRLIVRLVRTGTLVAATAVASATLLHAVSTWSVLPGVGPTPASRLWFGPVHTATEDRSPFAKVPLTPSP